MDKGELIKKTQELADKHADKKQIIEFALNDLDLKKEFTQEHIDGMDLIEKWFNELVELENEQAELINKIKGN